MTETVCCVRLSVSTAVSMFSRHGRVSPVTFCPSPSALLVKCFVLNASMLIKTAQISCAPVCTVKMRSGGCLVFLVVLLT